MKICIDARLYKETGVGRYIRSLIKYLPDLDNENHYSLLLLPEDCKNISLPNNKWNIIPARARWHTLKEQIVIPQVLRMEKPDLVHFPYFNVPIFYNGKFIVTIHDLTILKFATGRASTHCSLYYGIKLQGFKIALNHAVYNSSKIITVSESVKKEIIDNFKVSPNKISVTYESGELESENTKSVENLPEDYLLYIGNAHPHKNLETLFVAFKIIKKQYPDLKLLLIGNDDYFYKRLKEYINKINLGNEVVTKGPVKNNQLAKYYKNAKAFIFPSLSEGFGIPGLEAMNLGCPVLASDIPTFKEIYRDGASYFNQNNPDNIAEKIISVLNDKNKKELLIQKGFERAKFFSWHKMASETLKIYNELNI